MSRRGKPYNPAGHLGLPTAQRHSKYGGFSEDNLAPHGAPPVLRATAKSPLTHPDAERRVTFLDKALQDSEVHALFRFIVGTMVGENRMRLMPSEDKTSVHVKTDGNNRLPFTDRERLEIGARQFVYSKLPEESQRDIDILTDQVMPRNDKRGREFYISPTHFGSIVSGSSDERVCKGAYIGTYKKLAHHINHLYVEWEMNQFRQRQEAKVAKKSRIDDLAEKNGFSARKLLA